MKKRWLIVAAALLALLLPAKFEMDDGGSVEYRSMVYCVTRYHRMDGVGGYLQGWGLEVLGWEVYRNVR